MATTSTSRPAGHSGQTDSALSVSAQALRKREARGPFVGNNVEMRYDRGKERFDAVSLRSASEVIF